MLEPCVFLEGGREAARMRVLAFLLGLAGVGLGGLWLLQGLNLVHMGPLLCVAECQTVEKGSVVWTNVGALVLVVGLAALAHAAHRRTRP
jgi:membrane-bound ClpP family serine protease